MLNRDFKEFIQSLNENNVRYLVVGGYAVALHGHPRYTKDLDVWIDPSVENAASLIKALQQFGFGSLGLKAEDFKDPDQIIQLGYPPNRIDLIMSLAGVDFESCFSAKKQITMENVTINFIDLENLKRNKRASGRQQDLADLENLE
ncbi:MAG TPA: hypothetical protein VGA99_06330 [bacterium]